MWTAWHITLSGHLRPIDRRKIQPKWKAVSVQEITFVIRTERAVRLDDILLRRTNLAFAGELSTARVQELAAIAAEELGWTESRREEEIARAWEILQTRHGVTESANTFSR